jgi:signal transduction histidine kinase
MNEVLESRRKSMLQIMLQSILALVVIIFLVEIIESWNYVEEEFMIPVLVIALSLISGLLILNRYVSSWIVALLWQVLVFTLIIFTDTPEGLIAGKSSLVWVLPILPAAFIARPWTSFLSAGVANGLVFWLASKSTMTYGQILPGVNVYLLALLWIIALLSWLAAKNMIAALENAYAEQERLTAILENAADGIVVLGKDGHIERANPVALNLFDGKLVELARPENNAEVEVPDGRIVSLNWAHVPGVGNVAVIRDVTTEMEAAQMKDAMLGVVSHELRTPLAAIIGAADMLQAIEDRAMMDGLIEIVLRNGARLLRLVNDLLDRAQLQKGEFSLEVKPFSPQSVEQELLDIVTQHRETTKLQIELDFHTDTDGPILGDLGRIVQIARNLIDNAVKFTTEGNIRVKAYLENATLRITVVDTGMGIPPAQLPNIWQAFRRGADYGTRRTQGVGLGLSIVHALVTKMGGETDVKSTEGQGSVFKITIPLESTNESE